MKPTEITDEVLAELAMEAITQVRRTLRRRMLHMINQEIQTINLDNSVAKDIGADYILSSKTCDVHFENGIRKDVRNVLKKYADLNMDLPKDKYAELWGIADGTVARYSWARIFRICKEELPEILKCVSSRYHVRLLTGVTKHSTNQACLDEEIPSIGIEVSWKPIRTWYGRRLSQQGRMTLVDALTTDKENIHA